ncbi:hypothetical protein A7Q09_09715 [Methylacidiphilum sp. Yel]|jgi:hypothetical protein|nr:hypothetical protein A7Q09_09715 [Methylacidiphilum sp. Yel]
MLTSLGDRFRMYIYEKEKVTCIETIQALLNSELPDPICIGSSANPSRGYDPTHWLILELKKKMHWLHWVLPLFYPSVRIFLLKLPNVTRLHKRRYRFLLVPEDHQGCLY